MLSDDEGRAAVRLARRAIEESLGDRPSRDAAAPFRSESFPPIFEDPRGVFVTILRHPSGELRGCIGFPLPVFPLRAALPRAARSAALDDPRFRPVGKEELGKVRLQVSVLTPPEELPSDPWERIPSYVQVGRDGLIVDSGSESGLLLPQVAMEHGWDAEEFLEETCEKAGLPRSAWRRPGTTVRRFEAEVFGEPTPGGAAQRDSLGGTV